MGDNVCRNSGKVDVEEEAAKEIRRKSEKMEWRRMTREEAIRLLDPETTVEAIAEIKYYAGFNAKTASIQAITEACELAVNDMRKQIPMKPQHIDANEEFDGNWKKTCPNCGKVFIERVTTASESYPIIYSTYKRCDKCGQAIDWEEK